MNARRRLAAALAARLPFHNGWVILACVCLAGFSRQGSAVATLSIFVEPMIREFGWSRTSISAAVSVGGILGALIAPALGSFLDRNGARAVLLLAVLLTSASTLLLSFSQSLAWFFVFYCVARMSFAGPYDLGIYGSVVNWFFRRRAFATSVVTLAQMVGLIFMPLIAYFVMQAAGWRSAWAAVGVTVLVVGFLPVWLLHVRRPEDLGQRLDGDASSPALSAGGSPVPEPAYTRAQALATPAFCLLGLFTVLAFPVQAGISLHQAPLLIERGLAPGVAAAAVSLFALFSAIAGFAYGFWPRRVPLRFALLLTGAVLCAACLLMARVASPLQAYVAASLFGAGVGGLLTMLPIAWADYFGRSSYGAIRGVALSFQIAGQAAGPVMSGALRDWTGSYGAALASFAALALAAGVAALFAAPPRRARG
jgi:OFA family oxalate/formate antiporter-like MFS transporter